MSTHSGVISDAIATLKRDIDEKTVQYQTTDVQYREAKARHDTLQQLGTRLGVEISRLSSELQNLEHQRRVALEDEREIRSYSFESDGTLTVESQNLAASRISLKGFSAMKGLDLSGGGGEVGYLIGVSGFNVGVVTNDDDTFYAIRRHIKNRGDRYILSEAAHMLIGNRPGGSLTVTLSQGGRPHVQGS